MDIENYEFPESIRGMDFTGDLESNGLLFEKKEKKAGELVISKPADKIWMICHKSNTTGECWDFIRDEELKKFGRSIARYNRRKGRKATVLPLSLAPKFYEHCGNQYFHFGMRFDFMLMEKIMGYYLPREKRKDTLIISKTLDCDRDYVEGSTSGPHSVESYAIRFGKRPKVSHEDWLNFSVAMYERCEVDVEIQLEIKQFLDMEILSDKLECNIDWQPAIDIEHKVAYWISWSEKVGFPCDKELAESLVDKFDKVCEDIEDELLPNMPFRCQTKTGGIGTLVNWEEYAESMVKNTNLTDIPIGWCWPEDGRNRQLPVWEPFTISGDYKATVTTFFHGKPAEPAKPAEPERLFVASVKAVKEKRDKDGNIIREAVEAVPGVRARKAKEAVEAKPEILSCYHDDAGLTTEPVIYFTAEDVWGPFTRIRWNNYELGSNLQVVDYLLKFTSWEPLEFTDKGSPKLTEDSFESIGTDGVGKQLKTYLITKSRRTSIKNFKDDSKGWLNLLRDDGRITPVNDTMGTPTARSRHSGLVNVPSGGALWGAEMRRCWTAYKDGVMFGIDSAGLEMRGLAHEMGDEDTTKEIIEGDIHTVLYNLVSDFTSSRGVNKGTTYGLIYGASDEKLGSLADVPGCREQFASEEKLLLRGWIKDGDLWRHKNWHPNKESLTINSSQNTVCGGIMRDRYMKGLQPLAACIDRITKQAEKGYLVGIDGRKLKVRSSHSALNLKLQSTGAILMKTTLVECMEALEKEGLLVIGEGYLPNKFVELFTFYHDEFQIGMPKDLITDEKVIKLDISEYDLTIKSEKKEAEKRLENAGARFKARQRRTIKKCWSNPKIDLESGTATLLYSPLGDICVEVFEKVGRDFDLDCPVTGEYDIGMNWYETH